MGTRTTDVISASALAKRLGVKTATLGKWRRLGRGPEGWFYVSSTFVVYPVVEVERFLAERMAARPSFSIPQASVVSGDDKGKVASKTTCGAQKRTPLNQTRERK